MRKTPRAFQENLSVICDELNLAKQWGKASIILTTHRSIYSQEKLQDALQRELANIGYAVASVVVNSIEGNFVEHILRHEDVESTVFCISKISWGVGSDHRDGYRTLNLYRETFVENKIKAVFLLTQQETLDLPDYAPDFWAFRHRVFEFVSPRGKRITQLPASLMLWHLDEGANPDVDGIGNKINNLEALLTGLSEQREMVASRIDLYYELGFLNWRVGNFPKAEESLKNGINLARTHNIADLLAKCQNGLSILLYENNHLSPALEMLELAQEGTPRDCIPYLNQAVVLFSMQKRYLSMQKGKKALSLCRKNPWAWNTLGYLYFFAGRMDEALACFIECADISPGPGFFPGTLALCYDEMGLHEKARSQFSYSKFDSSSIILEVLDVYFQKGKGKASAFIEENLSAGKLTKLDVSRNPILTIILNPKVAT